MGGIEEILAVKEMIQGMAREAKLSARQLRTARTSEKNAALDFMAENILARKEEIIKTLYRNTCLKSIFTGYERRFQASVNVKGIV